MSKRDESENKNWNLKKRLNVIAHFEKCKQLCEHQHLLLLKETSGGRISNPYLNVVHFKTPELIRNMWQLKTAVFLHWCQICALPLTKYVRNVLGTFYELHRYLLQTS